MDYPNITQDKLTILYIIRKLDKSVTNLQMLDLILETTAIDYFSLQQLLLDLENSEFILSFYINENRYYKITESGNSLLNSLIHLIPEFLIYRIDSKITLVEKKIKQKSVVFADYTPENENSFNVCCKICEGSRTLVQLELNVPTKTEAVSICNRWYENPNDCYANIIGIFSKNI